ncbi:hypothetical protein HZB89_01115, partial [archaeon]|nr:hypothetical protein [archaeon]
MNASHAGIEKSISRAGEKLKEKELVKAKAEIQLKDLDEALRLLDKGRKQCPVCRKTLEEKEAGELKKHYFEESRKLNERLVQANKELPEIEKQLNELIEAKSRHLSMQERIKALHERKLEIAKALEGKDLSRLKKSLAEANEKKSRAARGLEEIMQEHGRLSGELNKQRELMKSREFDELEGRLNALNNKLHSLNNEIHSLKTEAEIVLANRIKELESDSLLIDESKALKEKELQELKQKIDALKDRQAELEIKLQDFLKENRKLMVEKDELVKKQAVMNESAKGLSVNAGILESEKQELRVALGRLEIRLEDLEEEGKEFR